MSDVPVVACRGLKKTYTTGPQDVVVLNGIDLDVRNGERVAIVGASGSGKSTLLHLVGGLDDPTSGDVTIEGRPFASLDEAERGRVRNRALGFIYQFHHLLPEFTAVENVAMPLAIRRMRADASEGAPMLERVGLRTATTTCPASFRRQRSASRRALVTEPRCVPRTSRRATRPPRPRGSSADAGAQPRSGHRVGNRHARPELAAPTHAAPGRRSPELRQSPTARSGAPPTRPACRASRAIPRPRRPPEAGARTVAAESPRSFSTSFMRGR
jgi:lipoprotein-releasing system ATP-binding protein